MCLAIPGKILSIQGEDFSRSARVSFGGLVRDVSLAYVPEAEVGDYVIVHVGFAISLLDEAEAMRTYEYLKQMDDLEELEQSSEQWKSGLRADQPLQHRFVAHGKGGAFEHGDLPLAEVGEHASNRLA